MSGRQLRAKSCGFTAWLNRESVAGVVCCLPFILGFLLFLLVPLAISLYYSFCNYDILSAPTWVGLDNYIKAFTDDPKFWKTLGVTLCYVVISVPLRLIAALAVALVMVKTTRATAVYRAVYYLPSLIGGSVAIAVLWKQMFAMDGVVNKLISGITGTEFHFSWFGNGTSAMFTLILLAVWQFGQSMLIFLASLKQIPTSLYEAAEVDGATKRRQFWSITLPLLTPTIFFNLIMQMINGFLAFTQCLVITQGKPMDNTLFYAVYMYQQSFEYYNTGYGAALAWIMMVIVGVATWLIFTTKKRWVYEGGY